MTQNEQILNYLKDGNSITPKTAYEKFNCMRLGARIHDLRKTNDIISIPTSYKNESGNYVTFATYRLV